MVYLCELVYNSSRSDARESVAKPQHGYAHVGFIFEEIEVKIGVAILRSLAPY